MLILAITLTVALVFADVKDVLRTRSGREARRRPLAL